MSYSRPPEPMPAATGGLLMPKAVGFRCEAEQVEARVPRRAVGVVAVGAVDLEPGAGAGVERAALRVVPDGQPGRLDRGRRTGQRPEPAPVGELVLRPLAIGEVAVQVARLRADRRHGLAGLVAALALVGVGDDVVVGPRAAVGVDPAHVDRVAGDVERGLGLRRVPDVGQADPAVGLVLEDPGLDQPAALATGRARRAG